MKNFLGYTLGGALTVGASVIPSLIFSALIFSHAGTYAYLMPVVLIIVVEKAFIFTIQGFGQITNPTKLILTDLIISMAGTIIAMFGYASAPMWSIGAALIALGMSTYAPMFRTYRDFRRRSGTWESNLAVAASYLAADPRVNSPNGNQIRMVIQLSYRGYQISPLRPVYPKSRISGNKKGISDFSEIPTYKIKAPMAGIIGTFLLMNKNAADYMVYSSLVRQS